MSESVILTTPAELRAIIAESVREAVAAATAKQRVNATDLAAELGVSAPHPAAQGDEEDAARLDWLESLSQVNLERVRYLGADKSIYEVTPFGDRRPGWWARSDSYDGDTLRAAIDAARAAKEGEPE